MLAPFTDNFDPYGETDLVTVECLELQHRASAEVPRLQRYSQQNPLLLRNLCPLPREEGNLSSEAGKKCPEMAWGRLLGRTELQDSVSPNFVNSYRPSILCLSHSVVHGELIERQTIGASNSPSPAELSFPSAGGGSRITRPGDAG
ncbi:hypothetical protein MMC27_007203 [Xylographa pallens]|nr:hypothetical protein [Xylographa pallens]